MLLRPKNRGMLAPTKRRGEEESEKGRVPPDLGVSHRERAHVIWHAAVCVCFTFYNLWGGEMERNNILYNIRCISLIFE